MELAYSSFGGGLGRELGTFFWNEGEEAENGVVKGLWRREMGYSLGCW